MEARTTPAGSPEPLLDEGFLTSRDGLRLYRRSLVPRDPDKVRAHVALVHGYGEHIGRYRETMERLANAGFAAHGIDYRGHGQSDGVRAHVDLFADYLADIDVLVGHARGRAEKKKLFVLGHSLGGLILATWALGRKEGVAGVVLCSPFMDLAFQPPQVKLMAAQVLQRLAPRLHMGNELNVDDLTHDPEIRRATKADPLYQHVTTAGWFQQIRLTQDDTLKRAGELGLPCLVLVGEADPIAAPAAGRRLFAALGSTDKTLKTYEGFLHELLNETDRDRVFVDLLGWLDKRL